MKAWWQSKTLWVNAIALIGTIVVEQLHFMDTSQWATLSASLLAVANILLRLDTTNGIGPRP